MGHSIFVALSGLVIAALAVVCALILDTVARGRRETRRLNYLRLPAPQQAIGFDEGPSKGASQDMGDA
jgi:hypothetical protein